MLSLAIALALSAAAVPASGSGSDEPGDEPWGAEEEDAGRLDLKLWGGQAWSERGTGLSSEAYGGEAAWRFDQLDVGLFGGCYGLRDETVSGTAETFFAPVYLVRLGQRFETRRGLLANFTLGAGALKASKWRSWFQVGLGARASFGPAFVAGELSFESDSFIRLSLGLGVSVL